LKEIVFARLGLPAQMVSDKRPQFVSEEMKDIFEAK
jgi:hypothetical protein